MRKTDEANFNSDWINCISYDCKYDYYGVGRKSSKETELNRAVATAVKQTVKASCGKNKEINSNDDMINFCMNNIAYNVSGTSDYEIEVMSVDYKEGMLDIIVTEKYTNVVGKEKKYYYKKSCNLWIK